jgi:hypothetical protein
VRYDLGEDTILKIQNTFKKYQSLSEVILYGSRAMGLNISKEKDERFNIAPAAAAAAKYLKNIDEHFRNETVLKGDLKTTPIENADERKNFDVAAYNAGEARIAQAQKLALTAGEAPTKWKNVQKYLVPAGATAKKAEEIIQYLIKVSACEKKFQKESSANTDAKFKKSKPIEPYPVGSHWVTINGRHIWIKD